MERSASKSRKSGKEGIFCLLNKRKNNLAKSELLPQKILKQCQKLFPTLFAYAFC